jgi:hypothetical protein
MTRSRKLGLVVRQALRTSRTAQDRLVSLRAVIEEGTSSGPGIPADDVFDELETRYRSMLSEPT